MPFWGYASLWERSFKRSPLQAPSWRASVCYGGASCARQTGSSAGSLCEARQHMKTAFDMCLNITSGRLRWSRWEEEECHEVRTTFCKCGPLLLWVQLEEGAWQRPGGFNFAAHRSEPLGGETVGPWDCVISVCWLGSSVFLVLRSLRGEILIWMGLPDYIKI